MPYTEIFFVNKMLFELSLSYFLFNYSGYIKIKCFWFYFMIFVGLLSASFWVAKLSWVKINISLIYIPIISNGLVLQKTYKLHINSFIPVFSL